MMSDRGKTHGGDAATLCAIGFSSKLARGDLRLQIRRDGVRGSRKDAFPWVFRRRKNLAKQTFMHVEDWIQAAQSE